MLVLLDLMVAAMFLGMAVFFFMNAIRISKKKREQKEMSDDNGSDKDKTE